MVKLRLQNTCLNSFGKRLLLIFSGLFLVTSLFADPPKPPNGFRWVLMNDYSDEFNGTQLDKTKWRDYFDGWAGRTPAKFMPGTISLKDGTMQIKNAVLDPAQGNYTIAGGAVQSLGEQAFYGYYECRFKASKIRMSTTFWLSNGKSLLDETTSCTTDKYSQELDIVEVVGGHTGTKFETNMNSNTHYRHIPCGQTSEIFYSRGASATLNSKVWEDYHTYACWWLNADSVKFYADDSYFSTVEIRKDIDPTKPFDRPMRVNMVTETYDWATPYPTADLLNNDAINTSYYDWVRAYQLVKVDSVLQKPVETGLLQNSGFEEGSLNNWPGWGGNPLEVVSNNQHSGKYAVHLVGGGAPEQVVALKSNTSYTLSCFAKVMKGKVVLGIKENNSTGKALASKEVSSEEYALNELKFTTAAETNLKIYFYAQTGNDEAYADDFELKEENQVIISDPVVTIFTESVSIQKPSSISSNSGKLNAVFEYKANQDLTANLQVLDKNNLEIYSAVVPVLKGFGVNSIDQLLGVPIVSGENYTLKLCLKSIDGTVQIASNTETVKATSTSGSEQTKRNEFKVFPNPVKDELRISGLTEPYEIRICNSLGKTIIQKTLGTNESLDVSSLSDGFYVLKAGEKSTKFIMSGKYNGILSQLNFRIQ